MNNQDLVPEHIKKLEHLQETADKMAETTRFHHTKAYTTAVEKHLMGDDNLIDYKKLDDSDMKKIFADTMVDSYINEIKKKVKGFDTNDPFNLDLLMDAYMGTTATQLRKFINESGSDYTQKQHEAIRDSLVTEVSKKLNATATAHLTDDHINDIVKYTQAGDYVNIAAMKIGDAVALHRIYKENGSMSKELIKNTYKKANQASPVYLKK